MARVRALVGAEVFGEGPAGLAPGVLELQARLGRPEHVHQQDPAATRQLRVRGSRLQIHLRTALLRCAHALPDANLRGILGSV